MTLADQPTGWDLDPWDAPERAVAVEPARRQNRVIKWAVWSALALGVAMVLIAGAAGWWYIRRINPPGDPGEPVSFTVAEDDTLLTLSERLERDGIIVDAGVFRWYVERNGGLEITPGYFELEPLDHMGNLLGTLRTPPAQTYTRVTFPEGFTVEQIARRLEDDMERMSADAFLAAAADPTVAASLRPPGVTSLEGLLFPDTYQVSNSESEGQVVERMVALMERVAGQE
ncbi:MAG TPA: endolytic transglycosylase MltG, partial [Ilumatobacteraceae bacterium]